MQIHGNLIAKLLLIIASAFQFLTAASVVATVSNTDIIKGTNVKLHLKAIGDDIKFPSIANIAGVHILGRHKGKSSSFSYINGKVENTHTTTLTLTFSPQKSMTIPSYALTIDGKEYKTQSITIKVRKATAASTVNNNKFTLRMKADKKSVVVGEAFMVTVFFSLQNGIRLSDNPQYTKPEFKGFFVKEIVQENAYRKGNYQVTEIKYVLTPQTEGNFKLEEAKAKIGLADTSRRDMFGRFFGTTWTPIVSNRVNIEVKEKLKDTDLVGEFSIKSNIDSKSVKANKPVNLTVQIKGKGSLEDFEFPNYEIDGVTIYSDDAKIESHVEKGKLLSTLSKNFVFIAEENFTIPVQSISVYDTKNATVNQLKIPAFHINVEAKKRVTASSDTASSNGVVQSNLKSLTPVKEKIVTKRVEQKSIVWWMLVIAFVLGMIFMYGVQFLTLAKWRRKESPFKESEALKILYAHISNDAEVETMVRKLYAKKNGDKSVIIDKKVLKTLVEKYRNQ